SCAWCVTRTLRPVSCVLFFFFFFQAEDGIRDLTVTGVQTCALPISVRRRYDRGLLPHLRSEHLMPATTRPGPRTPVWTDLSAHAARLAAVPVQELFERDPKRFERLSREQSGLLMDFSRQRLDEIALAKLFALADVIGLRGRIDAMWQGAHINTTEDRAVLHVALRQPHGAGVGGADIERAVMAERARMLDFARGVREGAIQGSAGAPFRLVVNIGIGGSDLGPAMAVQALSAFSLGAPRCEFVSNIDGVHLADVLREADPGTTLFIVSSKTFTTLETLTNARTARAWLEIGRAHV